MRHTLTVMLLLIAGNALHAAESWNQWRGPGRDGHAEWLAGAVEWSGDVETIWSVAVGTGHASPVVDGKRVCVHTRQDDEEVVACYGLVDGRQLWRSADPVRFKAAMGAGHHGAGPKATPVLTEGGVLVTYGITSLLSAFDVETGQRLWRRDFGDELGEAWPRWGTSYSPLMINDDAIEGDFIVQYGRQKGALVRIDGESGATVWALEGDGSAYSSPLLATFEGVQQIVTASNEELMGVSLDGRLLWRTPHPSTLLHQGIATPVLAGKLLVASTGKHPLKALRITRGAATWSVAEAWQREDIALEMSSLVVVGDELCGIWQRRKGQAFCLAADDGSTRWEGPPRFGEYASIIATPGALLYQLASGEMVVLAAPSESYTELGRFRTAESEVWAHPAPLPGGRLVIKSHDRLALITID